MKNFAVIGVGGFIAPRHLKAIKDTGNTVICAVDPHDSVGILDSYFPGCFYRKDFEMFEHRDVPRLREEGKKIDYVSICSPNYLHDAHIRAGLAMGADVICEKPLVINPRNLDSLKEYEDEFGGKINVVHQLRLHPNLINLRNRISGSTDRYDVKLTYVTRRGRWYNQTWKNNLAQSGGILMNIGVHFFDLLLWIFGDVLTYDVNFVYHNKAKGHLELERADVDWFLSIDDRDLPKDNDGHAFRCLRVDKNNIDLSCEFESLHTRIYEELLAGRGFGVDDARPAIELVYNLRRG